MQDWKFASWLINKTNIFLCTLIIRASVVAELSYAPSRWKEMKMLSILKPERNTPKLGSIEQSA